MDLSKLIAKKPQSNASLVTIQLLKKLSVPVTISTAIEAVEEHPNHPSLLSISDSLSKWNIDHVALRVNQKNLEELPTPFIAHTNKGKGTFILVNSINGAVEYIDEKGKSKLKSKKEFMDEWDNVVLLAESNKLSGERLFELERKKEIQNNLRLPFLVFSCLSLIIIYSCFAPIPSLAYYLLLIFKFCGCVITSLLLWFELDKHNPKLQQICSANNKTNCSAVLESKHAKLFDVISWSEIGFFYFTGSFLFFLLNKPNLSKDAFSLLAWLNILALPYTVFSISYQWKIAKQWCPLCLLVQGLLVLEFVDCYFGSWVTDYSFVFSFQLFFSLFISFLIPIIFWVMSKPSFLSFQSLKQYKKDLVKMKYSKEIFDALLTKQKKILVPNNIGIVLGNHLGKDTIIKICNPFCGPCSKAHPKINELLEQKPDLKVQIIFSGIKDNDDDKVNKVVSNLIALYKRNDPSLIKQALDDWYVNSEWDYNFFANKYPLDGELQDHRGELDAMKKCCDEISVSFTPTYFINGYQLPEVFQLEDLKNIL